MTEHGIPLCESSSKKTETRLFKRFEPRTPDCEAHRHAAYYCVISSKARWSCVHRHLAKPLAEDDESSHSQYWRQWSLISTTTEPVTGFVSPVLTNKQGRFSYHTVVQLVTKSKRDYSVCSTLPFDPILRLQNSVHTYFSKIHIKLSLPSTSRSQNCLFLYSFPATIAYPFIQCVLHSPPISCA